MDDPRTKSSSEAAYDAALDNTFPASDPPAATSPTRSITINHTGPQQPASKPGRAAQADPLLHGPR